MTDPGLDAAFLEYFRNPDPEARRRIHGAYVDLFSACRNVVDLACGEGDMVALLSEAGIDALGVDDDVGCVARARALGRSVEERPVHEWLAAQSAGGIDGLFCAHLVEHLGYEEVLGLYEQALRVLAPGGIMVTVTPNVRALHSHLETFYKHFGHVRFYHPELLEFLAHRAGFESSEIGESPEGTRPVFGHRTPAAPADVVPSADVAAPSTAGARLRLPRYTPDLPRGKGALAGWWWHVKSALARLVVRPYLDPLVEDLHVALVELDAEQRRLAGLVGRAEQGAAEALAEVDETRERLDRPMEAYVVSRKSVRT